MKDFHWMGKNMSGNVKERIEALNKRIRTLKLKRDAFSMLGQSNKVQETEKQIHNLEEELIKLKLHNTK